MLRRSSILIAINSQASVKPHRGDIFTVSYKPLQRLELRKTKSQPSTMRLLTAPEFYGSCKYICKYFFNFETLFEADSGNA